MVFRHSLIHCILWVSFPFVSYADPAIPALYVQVANEHGIPAKVLYGVALTESRKKLTNGNVRPWPWTLNVEGKAYFYNSSEQACLALTRFLTTTSIVDIGLTQQNWRYQGEHFVSPCSVLEPRTNLNHAAKLLKQGYLVHGSWLDAAGWFHRPAGGALAEKYKSSFFTNYRSVSYE